MSINTNTSTFRQECIREARQALNLVDISTYGLTGDEILQLASDTFFAGDPT